MTCGQRWAIQRRNEERVQKRIPNIEKKPGIYAIYRTDEQGIGYVYVGQAKNVLQRLAQHLSGYTQHIDLSIKKRGIYDKEKNPYGWDFTVIQYCDECELDEREKFWIGSYARSGFQMLNATADGQGKGKPATYNAGPRKGYRDGVEQGEKNIRAQLRELFTKYLCASVRDPANKVKERKLKEFEDMMKDD